MALIPENRYPGKTTPATGDYPYGSAKNIAVPGDGTGTPWEKDIVNDTLGFHQALLTEAGVVPDGDVDTVNDSQYLQAAKKVLKSGRKNYIINGNLNTTIINQDGFGGGQPAAGVYGYDMWKGDTLGTRIEQVIVNSEVINESFVISWVGGTGTADVDGVTGLSSGDTFTLNTSGNFSVIIPTDATYVQLEKGTVATEFEPIDFGSELVKCMQFYEKSYEADVAPGTASAFGGMYISSATGANSSPSGTEGFNSTVRFRVEKAATPSIRTYNPRSGAPDTLDDRATGTPLLAFVLPSSVSNSGFCTVNGASCIDSRSYAYHWVADSRL